MRIDGRLLLLIVVIVFQQLYARSHQHDIEQPVGLGMFEYLFRHPETLVGQRFDYPVSK